MSGEVSYIEFGVDDTAAARAFYGSLFGWQFETGPSGEGFAIKTPNVPAGMHGGDREGSACIFYAVDDMEAAEVRVRELGGQVLGLDIEGDAESVRKFGSFKLCQDPQGANFGLHRKPV